MGSNRVEQPALLKLIVRAWADVGYPSTGEPFAGSMKDMCGRFAMNKETDDLIVEFVADGNDFKEWRPSYSRAPTDVIPIVRERKKQDSGEVTRVIDSAIWNFHPVFMKDAKRPQFNARLETLATSGLWKGAFASSRCIVPMLGYYEWTEVVEDGKKVKQPHFIHGGTDLLAAAGIYTAPKVKDV